MAGGVNGLEPFCGGDRDFSGMLGRGSPNTGMAASPEAAKRCACLRRALRATTVLVRMSDGRGVLNWLHGGCFTGRTRNMTTANAKTCAPRPKLIVKMGRRF